MTNYPTLPDFKTLSDKITLYTQLKHEYGARGIDNILRKLDRALKSAQHDLQRLPADRELAAKEPSGLKEISALRPKGPRLISSPTAREYAPRLEGALLARMAGCTLGAPVEMWDIKGMKELATANGDAFPPVNYWSRLPFPYHTRYGVSKCEEYTRSGMKNVPVDDDIVYTLLGLLIVEKYGPGFSTGDVGKAWLKYLPTACTAEDIALKNLKASVPATRAAEKENPYCEWIGADIRADPWGYMAPGWPERAAEMAWRDAYLSHRRNGIYGEMYFAAVIAAAFVVDDPVEALKIGLSEIPRDCSLAKAVRWALKVAPKIRNYKQARAMVDKHFPGMSTVHTINNTCLTIWGVTIGGTDVTKVIGETVAMGYDNDCTAATAGSIVGAVVGRKGVPKQWHCPFNNIVNSYFYSNPKFRIDDLVRRFTKQAMRIVKKA